MFPRGAVTFSESSQNKINFSTFHLKIISARQSCVGKSGLKTGVRSEGSAWSAAPGRAAQVTDPPGPAGGPHIPRRHRLSFVEAEKRSLQTGTSQSQGPCSQVPPPPEAPCSVRAESLPLSAHLLSCRFPGLSSPHRCLGVSDLLSSGSEDSRAPQKLQPLRPCSPPAERVCLPSSPLCFTPTAFVPVPTSTSSWLSPPQGQVPIVPSSLPAPSLPCHLSLPLPAST